MTDVTQIRFAPAVASMRDYLEPHLPWLEKVGIAFPLLPRWITYSLLSRNTKGWLYDRPDRGRTALEVLDEIYRGRYAPDLSPTCDVQKIAGRMLDWLSPNAFEHLVCELLQLEQPQIRWWHVGGSGDGGADGLAVNDKGCLVAALQCKWKDAGDANALASNLKERVSSKWGKDVRAYIATLYDALPESKNPDVIFLDRKRQRKYTIDNFVVGCCLLRCYCRTLQCPPPDWPL